MLTVDGKEVDRKTIEHTIPLLMSVDESFDVGLDTRTPVDFTYDCPFRFTGTIDKLTFNLGQVAVVGRGPEEDGRRHRQSQQLGGRNTATNHKRAASPTLAAHDRALEATNAN